MKDNNKLQCNLSTKRLNSLLRNVLKSKGLDEYFLLDIVEFFVEQGARVSFDKDVIIDVAKNGYFNVVKYLVENGGEVSSKLIELAVKNSKVDVVKYLISKEPKLVLENDNILSSAIIRGRIELVKEILKFPESKEILNMWHLSIAIENHQLDMFNLLMKYLNKYNLIDSDYIYCLELAIKEHQLDMLKKLIDAGVNFTENLLLLAISFNNYDCFKYILDKKEFSIDTISKAIFKACDRRWIKTQIISELLKKPHYKWCVKDSIKTIRKNKRKEWVPSSIKSMKDTIDMLKKDENVVKDIM